MADDSELDYLVTFLKECHATATVSSFSTVKKIFLINDTERILVLPGELVSTDNSIKEISLELGFQTIHYFSLIFKKKVGVTPSEFRKQTTIQPRK